MTTALRKDVVDGPSFSQDLFNNEEIVKIRDAAIKTEFIKGMISGTLNPNYYGGYMVQDAAYCFDAVKAFDEAARKMEEQEMFEFSEIYQSQSTSLTEYNKEFVTTWHLQNTKSIVMGPAAKTYVEYEGRVSRDYPKFLAIAICYRATCFGRGLPISSSILLPSRIRTTKAGLKKTRPSQITKVTWRSLLILISALRKRRRLLLSSAME